MNKSPTVLCKGRFLTLVKEGRWEYVDRVGATGAAIIVALTTENELLIVEQFRIPVHARTIELPAGITGDTGAAESDAEAAKRELLEETGYEAGDIKPLVTGAASSGLTSERVTLFLATGLRRINAGGGVEHEEITVHKVALEKVASWLRDRAAEDCLIDPKLYAGLYFLQNAQV